MNIDWVGRYELISPLGQGAMGEVYRARDPELNREVAIKLIARTVIDKADRSYQRFRREVQVAARLNHPHIVTIYDVDLEHKPPYMVMELLSGGTLTDYFAQNELDWCSAIRLLRPICSALAYAHDAGIVHRDVKPDNILFSSRPGEHPKLEDFGLAFWLDDDRLTQDGVILGTVAYIAPEQALGMPVDARADIFSLGVILYEAMAGYNPIRGKTISQTILNACSLDPVDTLPLKEQVPQPVIDLLDKALFKERRRRFPSCRALEGEMDRLLGESSAADSPSIVTKPTLKPFVENPFAITLPEHSPEILRHLFTGQKQVVIEEELKGGFSGSRIFVVKPIRTDGTPELPTVVKTGPVQLIEKEWRAYQEHICNQLPGIAEIKGEPVILPAINWGGIQYSLVGSDTFYFESLAHYYRRASARDLAYLLEQRLLRQLSRLWRYNIPVTGFDFGGSYDRLLPVNFMLRPCDGTPNGESILLAAGEKPPSTPSPGDHVQLTGFIVDEVDQDGQIVTLDWPAGNGLSRSYRVRLQAVDDLEAFRVGYVVDDFHGIVTTTRMIALKVTMMELLGVDFNTSAADLELPGDLSLPNPLDRLPAILAQKPTVRVAKIHGDLNPRNVLVEPDTRNLQIIDFGAARRDHVLQDLVLLEAGIVTWLLPQTLKSTRLPVQSVVGLYSRLHDAAYSRQVYLPTDVIHPELDKPFRALMAVRQAVHSYLYDPNDQAEYYQALTVGLLGCLKFRNLDQTAKLAAFWAASTAQSLVDTMRIPVQVESTANRFEPATQVVSREEPVDDFWQEPEAAPPRVQRHRTRTGNIWEWLGENWITALLLGSLAVVLTVIAVWAIIQNKEEEEVEPSPSTEVVEGVPGSTTPEVLITREVSTPTVQPVTRPELTLPPMPEALMPVDSLEGQTMVILLLDTSASMQNDKKLVNVLAGVAHFLERLDEDDEIRVFTFGDQVRLVEPNGPVGLVRDSLAQQLAQLFPSGDTLLYDAICQAAESLEEDSAIGPGRLVTIVLLTDGRDSGRGEITTEQQALACFADISNQVQIHAIALGSDADEDFLRGLVGQSDTYFYYSNPESIDQLFQKIVFD